jgi:hypothetical protein
MREIYYACPFCNKSFRGEYSATQLNCPTCGNTLQIEWLTNGKQECGVVGTTLVCFLGATVSIKLPDNITVIGKDVFENSSIKEIILPNTVQEIREGAFLHCCALQNIELSTSLKIIRKDAFALSGVQKLQIPQAVELIEDGAFSYCSYIKEISVHKDNPYYYVENEQLIDSRTKQVLATCCKNKVFFKITIDSNVGKQKAREMFFKNFNEYYDEKRVTKALNEIVQDENKFIICEADTPIHNITYIQAMGDENGIHLEFHLLKSPDDTAWENWSFTCDLSKCVQYVCAFFRGEFVPNFAEWKLECSEE